MFRQLYPEILEDYYGRLEKIGVNRGREAQTEREQGGPDLTRAEDGLREQRGGPAELSERVRSGPVVERNATLGQISLKNILNKPDSKTRATKIPMQANVVQPAAEKLFLSVFVFLTPLALNKLY